MPWQIFIGEKTWEGCQGLVITEAMQVAIAALASLLVLGMDDFYFDNVQTILLYPSGFVVHREGVDPSGVLEEDSDLLGEAQYRGPVILSWAEIEAGLNDPWHGDNLVIHEFVHQLDSLNGEMDSVPLLPAGLENRWQTIMHREYKHLCRMADRGVEDTLIDPYGTTNPAEFFAVVSESFFEVPAELKQEHPKLYELLRDYFRQDPASWFGNN